MSRASPTLRRAATGHHFRAEIERAEAAGVGRADMTLQLTLYDVSQLKRDRSLALTDISFADGEMRFLGVKVVQGGADVSALNYESTP